MATQWNPSETTWQLILTAYINSNEKFSFCIKSFLNKNVKNISLWWWIDVVSHLGEIQSVIPSVSWPSLFFGLITFSSEVSLSVSTRGKMMRMNGNQMTRMKNWNNIDIGLFAKCTTSVDREWNGRSIDYPKLSVPWRISNSFNLPWLFAVKSRSKNSDYKR